MQLMGFSSRYSELFGHENGFPQVVSDTQAYRQFGNSVVPQVVEAVGEEVVRTMAEVFLRSNNGCLIKGRSIAA